MTQIITVTPSPAIDVSTSLAGIEPFRKLRCAAPKRDPGGGGINVARVVRRFGGSVTAIYPAGGATGHLLRRLMDAEGVPSLAISTAEETREDFTVFEASTSRQYRFVMPGAVLQDREWHECLDRVRAITPAPDFIVASGSLPPGVPDDFYARLARIAKDIQAKMVVDTSGAPLRMALDEGVYLIKPNLREFQELTGERSAEDGALVKAARDLLERDQASVIALSLGSRGALLVDRDQALRADALAVAPASVVGAGDSFLGAMIWALAAGQTHGEALRYGVAAGASALLRPGTDLCLPGEVGELVRSVNVRTV